MKASLQKINNSTPKIPSNSVEAIIFVEKYFFLSSTGQFFTNTNIDSPRHIVVMLMMIDAYTLRISTKPYSSVDIQAVRKGSITNPTTLLNAPPKTIKMVFLKRTLYLFSLIKQYLFQFFCHFINLLLCRYIPYKPF